MIRSLFSFCILFIVMWCGLLAYTLYQQVHDYYNQNQLLVIEIADLTKTLAEDESNYMNEKIKKREYEMALEYNFATITKIRAATHASRWLLFEAMPKFSKYANPFSDACLKDDIITQKNNFLNECQQADAKGTEIREKLKQCQQKIAALEAEKQKKETLYKEKKESLQKLQNRIKDVAMEYILHGWRAPLNISILLSFGVILYRFLAYFVLAPILLNMMKAVELPPSVNGTTQLGIGTEGHKIIHCELPMNETITLKDESYCGGYTDHASVPRLEKRTCLVYSMRYWLMSLMCGLTIMTRFANKNSATQHIRITSDDPDEYFCKIELRRGEPLFVTPSDLVAFSKGVKIKSINHFFSLSAWAMGQLRYYVLEGQGYVVLRSNGGMSCIQSDHTLLNVHKKHSIINACGRLSLNARRTETFIPYLIGNSPLFDVLVRGEGAYHIRNTSRKALTPSEKFAGVFFSSLGKLLGF